MNISVVIPTKNREKLLEKCVNHIIDQSYKPIELIIVDDGRLSVSFVAITETQANVKGISFQYHLKKDPGACESRNLGARYAHGDIVLFVDDDIMLDKEFIKVIKDDWAYYGIESGCFGIGGIIENERKIYWIEKIYNKIFHLSTPMAWDITRAGYQCWDPTINHKQVGYYINGGCFSAKRSSFLRYPYRQLSTGLSPCDEVDLCMRAKKMGFYFVIDSNAKAYHYEFIDGKDGQIKLGFKEGKNRIKMFRDNKGIDTIWCEFIWASIGWNLRQYLSLNLFKGIGMTAGYLYGYFKK